MMKAGETDSLVSNHKSYEATCEYILQNTKVYDYEDSEVMYVDMYGTTQMLYKEGELKYGKKEMSISPACILMKQMEMQMIL